MGILTSPLVVVTVPRSLFGGELAEEVLLLVIVVVLVLVLVVVIAVLMSVFGFVLLSIRRRVIRVCGVVANDLDITALLGSSGSGS